MILTQNNYYIFYRRFKKNIAQKIGSKSIFTGPIDNQIISKEIKNAPESKNAIDFILRYIN